MSHELVAGLWSALDPLHGLAEAAASSGGGSNSAVVITLITTAGTVIAAGIAAVAATFRRDSSPASTSPAIAITTEYVAELRRRAERAERELDEREDDCTRMRGLLLGAHINPDTGDPL